jgi:hypothetical protein
LDDACRAGGGTSRRLPRSHHLRFAFELSATALAQRWSAGFVDMQHSERPAARAEVKFNWRSFEKNKEAPLVGALFYVRRNCAVKPILLVRQGAPSCFHALVAQVCWLIDRSFGELSAVLRIFPKMI